MKFENHEAFFESCGAYSVRAELPEAGIQVSIEEMYSHFKERLLDELAAEHYMKKEKYGRRRADTSMRKQNEQSA
ncbi:MAG TPA: hypothetical protein VD999_07690 [Vitreimonas sp.]|nr:hypothetical protein [Vitreimonas sp.]